MLAMFQDLVRHKVHANAALVQAIGEHDAAARDAELRTLLHHVILANRFWFSLMHGDPFDAEKESRVSDSLEGIAQLYRSTHTEELAWIAAIHNEDLNAPPGSASWVARRRRWISSSG